MQQERTGSWAWAPLRARPLRPASPAHSRSRLQAERAEHRERAAWGSRGGRARAAPSLPLPSALGPRGPRRSGKMALHFQVSVPGRGPGAPAAGCGGGGGGIPGRDPEHSPWPGDGGAAGSEERAALGPPSPPSSARLQQRPGRREPGPRGSHPALTLSPRSAPSRGA